MLLFLVEYNYYLEQLSCEACTLSCMSGMPTIQLNDNSNSKQLSTCIYRLGSVSWLEDEE
jgi:hypothetical protein